MPDTTPTYGLPFPETTDPTDVPGDIGALALAVETTVDTIDDRVDVTEASLTTNDARLDLLENPPRCAVFNSVGQSIPNNTVTTLTFDSESVDTDGMHNPAANPSRITINTAGRYRVSAQLAIASNATGFRNIFFNLSGVSTGIQVRANALNGATHAHQCYGEVLCAAGDYLEMDVQQSSGVSLATVAGVFTFLSAVWCGTN